MVPSKKKGSKAPWRMADSTVGTEKIQHEPGASSNARGKKVFKKIQKDGGLSKGHRNHVNFRKLTRAEARKI